MTNVTYKTLILPGNGVKAIYTLGALQHLCEKGVLNGLENCVAVSSGSLVSALLLLGLKPIEILARVLSKNLFQKIGRVSMVGIAGGAAIFNFDVIEKELEAIFMEQLGIVPTFEQFYNITNVNYVCVAYDATSHKCVFFSKDTFPDVSVLKAIKASCAYPLLFDPVYIDDCVYIDGGVGDNYPITWALTKFPGPALSIYVITKLKPITKYTTRLVSVKEILSVIIRKPDQIEIKNNEGKINIVKIHLEKINFFDFSHNDHVYITQFDDGNKLCKLNFKK